MAYVIYLLIFEENNLYIGLTNNLARRIREHKVTYDNLFETEILFEQLTYLEACNKETELITYYRNIYGSKLLNKANKGIAPTGVSGEKHHASKISDENVLELRNSWLKSKGSIELSTLAQKYGFTGQHMGRILRGLAYKDAGGPILGKDYV